MRRPTGACGRGSHSGDCPDRLAVDAKVEIRSSAGEELLAWDRDAIRDLARHYPPIAENALRISPRYLKTFIGRHAWLKSGTAQERLGAALPGLAHRVGNVRAPGIEMEAANEELGGLVY